MIRHEGLLPLNYLLLFFNIPKSDGYCELDSPPLILLNFNLGLVSFSESDGYCELSVIELNLP